MYISFSQIFVILILVLLFFGNFPNIIDYFKRIIKNIKKN